MPGRTRKYTPASVPNCKAYFVAYAGITITSGAVSAWADRTGALTGSQATSGFRPTVSAGAAPSGRDMIAFVAANTQRLDCAAGPGITGDPTFECYSVGQWALNTSQGCLFGWGTTASGQEFSHLGNFPSNGSFTTFWGNSRYNEFGTPIAANTPHLFHTKVVPGQINGNVTCVRDGSSQAQSTSLNGTQVPALSSGSLRLGGLATDFNSFYLNGKLGAVALYNRALTTNEDLFVTGFLRADWGV